MITTGSGDDVIVGGEDGELVDDVQISTHTAVARTVSVVIVSLPPSSGFVERIRSMSAGSLSSPASGAGALAPRPSRSSRCRRSRCCCRRPR